MTAREVIKKLQNDGWYIDSQKGSHCHLKHATKTGKVTVPIHKGDIKKGTLNSISKQAGWK